MKVKYLIKELEQLESPEAEVVIEDDYANCHQFNVRKFKDTVYFEIKYHEGV